MGASDSLLTFPSVSSYSFSFAGMEFVTMTWSSCDFFMFSRAFPVNSPWVAKAETERAPFYLRTLVAQQSVPAVSMISSTITTFFPATLPTICMLPILPACTLCLIIIAKVVSFTPKESRRPWKFLALVTPPASGETTETSLKGIWFCSTKQLRATKLASKLSTGTRGPKKPCIWPECTSTKTTRSTPTVSKSLATSAAEMGTLGAVFLSCRAQPQQGMITLIFFAEALLIVETMSNSYTKFSLTGGQVDWIMKTFLDLTLSMTSILHYPSLNLPTLMLPRSICRMSAICWESSLLELPEKMTMSFLKLIATLPKLFSEFE